MAELFEIIKRQMEVKRLKPAQIAGHMDISQRMVEFYIKGTRKPSFKNLVKLSELLGFDMNELTEQIVQKEIKTKKPIKYQENDGDSSLVSEYREKYLNALEMIRELQSQLLLNHQNDNVKKKQKDANNSAA